MEQISTLVGRGRLIIGEVEQLAGKLSLYNIAKLLVDDDTFELMDYFEQEGGKTRLSYHAFYGSTHKRWVEWANDVESAMLRITSLRSELSRFRKLRDQVNRTYSKREIDLPSISVRMKEQVAIVERLPSFTEQKTVPNPVKPRKALPKSFPKRARIGRIVERIEKNPYYKLVIIVSGFLGFILVLLRFLALL